MIQFAWLREKAFARDAFIDRTACQKFVEEARGRVPKRVAEESAQ